MITWDRTSFDKGARKVVHVVPSATTAAVYQDICNKYGGENVWRCSGAGDDVEIEAAINACTTGANDIVRLYPGTFVLAGVIDVAKTVTIEGATDNANAVIIDCDTANVAAFTVAASGVTIRNLTIAEANTAITHTLGCTSTSYTGFVVENIVIRGGDALNTNGTIYSAAAYTIVRNCKLYAVQSGVKIAGGNSIVENNIIIGGSAAAGSYGIFLTGPDTRSGQIVRNNTVLMPGATSCTAVTLTAESAIGSVILNNQLYAATNWSISTDTYTVANLPIATTITATESWIGA